jgi:hypothetical protein
MIILSIPFDKAVSYWSSKREAAFTAKKRSSASEPWRENTTGFPAKQFEGRYLRRFR